MMKKKHTTDGWWRYASIFTCVNLNLIHSIVEQNTDAILDNPEKSEKAKHKSQEEIEETVSTRKLHLSRPSGIPSNRILTY